MWFGINFMFSQNIMEANRHWLFLLFKDCFYLNFIVLFLLNVKKQKIFINLRVLHLKICKMLHLANIEGVKISVKYCLLTEKFVKSNFFSPWGFPLFYWNTIDLQCCIRLMCTLKWFIYLCLYSFSDYQTLWHKALLFYI